MPDLTPPAKPSRSYGFLSIAVLAVAAVVALAAAWGALVSVEQSSKSAVERALFLAGEDWAEVHTNGLQVILSGKAPSEAARFAALSAAGHEVDGARVIDQVEAPEAVAIEPPRFSIEMLRNQAGISLIGLVPAETDRAALADGMRAIDPIKPVADFLEAADHPTPEGWDEALDYLLYATEMLPRSKISMDAEHVAVEAIAGSPAQKQDWERAIRRKRPAGVRLALDIRAPLDVVSPYIVRFLSDDEGTRFEACTAYNPADRTRIVAAGKAAGVKGDVDCELGLGVPSPAWPEAVARGIQAVHDLRGGSLTFSDADVTLIAPENTPQDTFDRVLGELEADLPAVFSLQGVLPVPETGPVSPAGPPEFIASLGEDGKVQLRGRVTAEQDRTIVESLARARFGTRNVYAPLRLDPALPASWAVRTLAGLEALGHLADGRVTVRPDVVTVTGSTGDKGASAKISRLLSEKLGGAEDFRVNVTYEEALDPIAAMPTPQECVAEINAVMTRNKITFAPGSAEIERSSASTVDQIAEIVKSCPDVAMEIAGYTDSQGREEMNQALSQRRAEAVVSALLARRVLTTNLAAFGYGEDSPIADNDTEAGREANRRIEFRLIGEAHQDTEPKSEGDDPPTIRPPARPTDDAGGDAQDDAAAEDAPEEAAEDAPEEAAEDADPAGGAAADAGGTAAEADSPAEDVAAVDEDRSGDAGDPVEDAAADAGDEGAEAGGDAAPDAPETLPGTIEAEAPDGPVEADAADAPVETVATEPTVAPEDAVETEAPVMPATGAAEAEVAEDLAEAPAAGAQAPATATGRDPAGETRTGPIGADPAETAAADPLDGDRSGSDTEAAVDDPSTDATEATAVEPTTSDAEIAADATAPEITDTETAAAETAADATGASAEAPGTEGDPEPVAEIDAAPEPEAETLAETDQTDPAERAADPDGAETPVADATGPAAADPAEDPAETDAALAAAEADPAATNDEADADAMPAPTDAEAGETAEDAEVAVVETDTTLAGAEAPAEFAAIRPRPRPLAAVNPELAGIRPKPRPAIVPDAPSTE